MEKYVKIPKKRVKRIQLYINKSRKTMAQIVKETGCTYAINAGLFTSKRAACCHLRADGYNYATDPYNYFGYGWDKDDKALRVVTAANKDSVENFICCVELIHDGKAAKLIYNSEGAGKRGRTVIGFDKEGNTFLYCSKDGSADAATPEALQAKMLGFGLESAIMLDGGLSSQCSFGGDTITSSRVVHNLILVYVNEATAEDLIEAARAEVGTKEMPANSNKVKYNMAYYGRDVSGAAYPWCMAFIWWLMTYIGAAKKFYGGGKCASCTAVYNYHKARGQVVTKDYRPGDLVFYDWDKSGDCDHVGVLAEISGNNCKVIEGNTAVGNDSNGGEVMLRSRTVSQIKGAVRLLESAKSAETKPGTETAPTNNNAVSGASAATPPTGGVSSKDDLEVARLISLMSDKQAWEIMDKAERYKG